MSFGISSASLYPLETEKSLEMIGKKNIPCAEVFFNSINEHKDDFVDKLVKLRDEYGIKISSVHPAFSLSESFLLFSAYERRTEEGFEIYKRYGEIASRLGAKYVILHGGKPNNVLDDYGYIERFYKLSSVVKEQGAVLLQENVVNFRAGSAEFLKKFTEYLKDDADICFDIKQAIRGNYDPIETINSIGKYIRHYHISDNCESSDCMLPCLGNFDFNEFIKAASKFDYKGDYIIEVYRSAYNGYEELFSSYFNLLRDIKK